MKTIIQTPHAVEVKVEESGREPFFCAWERMTWATFADANHDEANQVAADLAIYGHASLGGGAAPIVRIRVSR